MDNHRRHPGPSARERRYRGSATLAVDGRLQSFPADYSQQGASDVIEIPAGRHQVIVSYRFAPPTGATPAIATTASMHVDAGPAIRWGSATPFDTAVMWAVNGLELLVFALMTDALARAAPRHALVAAAAVGIGVAIALLPIGGYARDKALEVVIIAGCLHWAWTARPALTYAVLALALLCTLRIWSGIGPPPGAADYRLRLDDGLTYESFAHDILDERSPRGGEGVFTLQIFFRYIRFAERMLFGEGEWLLLAGVLTAMNAAYTWLAHRVIIASTGHRPTLLAATGLMLWMMNGASGAIEAPMSEYPTWALLPVSMGLLFLSRRRREWLIASALMGIATLTRFNQLPAYAVVLVVFAAAPDAAGRRPRWFDLFCCAAIFGAIVVGLPIAHNYWYGHALTVLPTNRYSSMVIDLHPAALFSGNRREAWALLLWKLRHLSHFGEVSDSTAFIPLHMLNTTHKK